MSFSTQTAVVNFLNEIAGEYPSAISLAAGRPTDHIAHKLNPAVLLNAFGVYETSAFRDHHTGKAATPILQYGRTAGVINDLVAEQLRLDEGVDASADRVLVTAGCQEALALCVPALCPSPNDVLLVCNPTYIGAAGVAHASGVSVYPLLNTCLTLTEGLTRAIHELQGTGRQPRALYLIPNFDNPTGLTLGAAERKRILEVCKIFHIVVLEDNPYGMFRYEGTDVKSMFAMDEAGSVIYLSTYSKTLAPAMRVGAAVLPDTLFGDRQARQALCNELVKRKSVLTVNTSQIMQAIVGGILLESQCSLRQWIQPALNVYRESRDALLSQLRAEFLSASSEIRWNHPAGGFFVSLDLPFKFGSEDVVDCATNHGVIVMPMSFFAFDDSQDHRVRLSFSAAEPERVRTAVASLARYVTSRIGRKTLFANALQNSQPISGAKGGI